jgi:invasion protein IalB
MSKLIWRAMLATLLNGLLTAGAWAAEDAKNESEDFKDWQLICQEGLPCRLEQRIYMEKPEQDKQPQRLLQISFLVDPGEKKGDRRLLANAITPLGILLPAGVGLAVDQGEEKRYQLHLCDVGGCLARFLVDEPLRQQLQMGKQARVRFFLPDGRGIGVPVSLQGVTAGLRALEAR